MAGNPTPEQIAMQHLHSATTQSLMTTSEPAKATSVCQVIDSKETFHFEACQNFLSDAAVGSWKTYNLLGVVGGTAAGKSTVLNALVRSLATHDICGKLVDNINLASVH